jgi:hypothetical protein
MSYSAIIENALKYSAKIEKAGIGVTEYSGTIDLLRTSDIDFDLCDHLGNTITDQNSNAIVCFFKRLELLYSATIEAIKELAYSAKLELLKKYSAIIEIFKK